ncbi:hypothetical protein ACFL6C_12835 [Myxococcota bacterium]
MARWLVSAILLLAGAGLCGCDDPPPGCDLDPKPQISPNAEEGVIGFKLTRRADGSKVDATFVNGGCPKLEVDVGALSIGGRDPGAFSIGEVYPASGEVSARGALGVPITFTSPGRGVHMATLVVQSNAENFPVYELDLVGPGTEWQIPDTADIEFFEPEVEVEETAFLDIPVAFVRFYNLGDRTANITDYRLADTDNFMFLGGTAEPGADCTYAAICAPGDGPEKGCCAGGIDCACPGGFNEQDECLESKCEEVYVTRGQFSILGVTFTDQASSGAHQTQFDIDYYYRDNALNRINASASVTVSGTK